MAQEISLSLEETNKLRISIGLKPIPAEPESVQRPEAVKRPEPSPASTASKAELTIEETNRLRASLGLKPIIVNESAPAQKEPLQTDVINGDGDVSQRLAEAKERLKRKGKTILDDDREVSQDAWLASLGQPQPKKAKIPQKKLTTHDLSGIKIGHSVKDLADADGEIFTLKDSELLDEEDGELSNDKLSQQAKLKRELKEKKKADSIKFNGRSYQLQESDEEELDEKLDDLVVAGSTIKVPQKPAQASEPRENKISLGNLFDDEDEEPTSTSAGPKPVTMKKIKKKSKSKSKSAPRTMSLDNEEMGMEVVELQYLDAEVDDERYLRDMIAQRRRTKQKARARWTPEQIAEEVVSAKRWELENQAEGEMYASNIVYNDTSDFLDSLQGNVLEEPEKDEYDLPSSAGKQQQKATAGENSKEVDSKETDQVEITESKESHSGEEEEDSNSAPTFNKGVASTLNFLKSRKIIDGPTQEQQQEARARREAAKAAELLRIKISIEERLLREEFEQDKSFLNLPKAERAEILDKALDHRLREKRIISDTSSRGKRTSGTASAGLASYNPRIKLSYRDDLGAELDTKGAFKYLSHQFHGVGPGNGKVEKKLKRAKEEHESTSETII